MPTTPARPGIAQPGITMPGDPGLPGFTPPVPDLSTLPNPSIPFFEAGYKSVSADWYGWWYLNSLFLQRKVVFRARQVTGTNSISNDGNPHRINYDTVDEDPWNGWNSGAFQWAPKLSGWYQVTVTAYLAALASGTMLLPHVGIGTNTFRLKSLQAATAHPAGAEGQYVAYMVGAGATTVQGMAAILNAGAPVPTSA